jgi:hypothetical protein
MFFGQQLDQLFTPIPDPSNSKCRAGIVNDLAIGLHELILEKVLRRCLLSVSMRETQRQSDRMGLATPHLFDCNATLCRFQG